MLSEAYGEMLFNTFRLLKMEMPFKALYKEVQVFDFVHSHVALNQISEDFA